MSNLFRSELYKWRKCKAFYICLLSAVGCVIVIWLSFLLADQVERGNIENGTMGITVTQQVPDAEEGTGILDEIQIMEFIQLFLGAGFSTLFMAIFISIWVIGEYTHGAVKNTIGKGYSRSSIFLTKYISSVLSALVLDLGILIVAVLIGVAVLGMERIGETFVRDCLAYAGVQLILGVAFSGIIAAVSEFARSMAAGITISMILAIFSSTLADGLDLIFKVVNIDFKVSNYWIANVIENCPIEGINMDVVGRAIYVTVMWTAISLFAGMVHFREADV